MSLLVEIKPVTLAAVVAGRHQREILRLYAAGQNRVQLVGVSTNGEGLLSMLEHRLRPQVILLDLYMLEGNILALLQQIRAVCDYAPKIIVVGSENIRNNLGEILLTSGANYTMLGVYRLPDVFAQIVEQAVDEEHLQQYHIVLKYDAVMNEMHAGSKLLGRSYAELMICSYLMADGVQSMRVLYQMVGDRYQISPDAVHSAIGRLSAALRDAGTKRYAELCANHGKPSSAVLSDRELIGGVADLIRTLF